MAFFQNYLICPLSPERINENIARLVAAVVSLTTILFFTTGWTAIIILLGIDFWVRGYTTFKYSIIRGGVRWLDSEILRLTPKPIAEAPKRFSARIGLLCCILISVASLAGLPYLANMVAGILLFCALLESIFSVCVGCHAYTLLIKLLDRNPG